LQDVAANLAGDADERSRLAVAINQQGWIFDALTHLGDITQADWRLVLDGNNGVANVLQIPILSGGEHQIARVVLVEPPDRTDAVRRAQAVGNVHERESVGKHLPGIDNHGHFARLARLHLHQRHTANTREQGPQDVITVVAQVRVGNIARKDVQKDGKGSGRDAFDREVDVGRQITAYVADARLGQLQGVLHVGVRVEEDGDLRRAPDGAGTHAPCAQYGSTRFLDRSRDREKHVLGREVPGVNQNHDAGKGQLRIDIAGEAEGRHQAAHRQKCGQQIDGVAVPSAELDHVHDLTLTLALSLSPYPPVRMMVSPGFTPESSSTRSLASIPSSTGTASAFSPSTRYTCGLPSSSR